VDILELPIKMQVVLLVAVALIVTQLFTEIMVLQLQMEVMGLLNQMFLYIIIPTVLSK